MTFLRSSDPGRGRDAERVVATLRRELLVPVDDELAARHLEAMLLEFDWELAPNPVILDRSTGRRKSSRHAGSPWR